MLMCYILQYINQSVFLTRRMGSCNIESMNIYLNKEEIQILIDSLGEESRRENFENPWE